MNSTPENAGRSCPIRYRYGAARIAQAPAQTCDVLYVVGGLYGNPFALDAIEAMAATEQGQVRLCFNGDFNWFNKSAEGFSEINRRVLRHECVLGNVEAELSEPLDSPDCGCAYPDNVDQGVVDRSNQIHTELKRTAQQQPELLRQILQNPFFARYSVGRLQVAVVHGDADSLAGWRFDPACLRNPQDADWRAGAFRQAQVDVFASSHTCTAAFHVERLHSEGQAGKVLHGANLGLISNNGAAGMPSVPGSTHGLITRIASTPFPDREMVYNAMPLKGAWVEQVRVQINQEKWLQYFLGEWPEGSAAHTSYFHRISQGA
ncbi:MAG TPA: hypothetical protein VFV28_10460 [Limnobacter sp.]|nr:hypothetical protein [Limnobacter sp.]